MRAIPSTFPRGVGVGECARQCAREVDHCPSRPSTSQHENKRNSSETQRISEGLLTVGRTDRTGVGRSIPSLPHNSFRCLGMVPSGSLPHHSALLDAFLGRGNPFPVRDRSQQWALHACLAGGRSHQRSRDTGPAWVLWPVSFWGGVPTHPGPALGGRPLGLVGSQFESGGRITRPVPLFAQSSQTNRPHSQGNVSPKMA